MTSSIGVIDMPWATGPWHVEETIKSVLQIPGTPREDRRHRHPDDLTDPRIGHPIGSKHDNPRTTRQTGPRRGRPQQPIEFVRITITQFQGRGQEH
ncbi:hypothetical protein LQ419_19145 [Gordonia paraffinivorans]|nr:hypothetical protein [Gordonia paraffinivorans]MCD2147333.1 hypothetical protein [Gordonia paraffinivorans]